jgi:AcrR family transcriptional regulator
VPSLSVGDCQNTRTRLLDTAERLFAAHGVQAVSVRDIIRASCANLGAVNYHFKNRQALVLEVFERRWNDLLATAHPA